MMKPCSIDAAQAWSAGVRGAASQPLGELPPHQRCCTSIFQHSPIPLHPPRSRCYDPSGMLLLFQQISALNLTAPLTHAKAP